MSTAPPLTPSTLAREIDQVPDCLVRQRALLREPIAALVERLRRQRPRWLICCGRGSSDHAGLYIRYLFETATGLPSASALPSVQSVYGGQLALRDTLVVLISQSGRSPDLIDYARAARRGGALTVGLINRPDSPLAAHCEQVLPLAAGEERAVAATKSVLATLYAALQWLAQWRADCALDQALAALPEQLRASAGDWSALVEVLARRDNLLLIGRGPGIGASHELALKFKETCALHAESFSAAEVLHGPLAMVRPGLPVLLLDQGDASAPSLEQAAERLRAAGANLYRAGSAALPAAASDDPRCTLLAQLQAAYRAVEATARARGLDPDRPAHIAKVTLTR